MTTKTTKKTDIQSAEVAALMAELAAVRAERDALATKAATRKTGNPRRAAWMADATGEDFTATEDTVLGRAQRQERELLCYTVQKVLRAIPNRKLPKLLAELTEMACEGGGIDGETTADALLTEAMTRKTRAPKLPEVQT